MPVALTPPSPVSPLRRSARLVQDISPTPVKSNPKLNTNLVHSASRKRPRAPGHSIIMANPELSTPRNDKLTHSPSRKRREPPTDSVFMANPELPTPRNNKLAHLPSRKRREPPTDSIIMSSLELPTPRMLRAEKRRRLSTPPTPPTPVRTPIPTRKRKAFSPSPLAEYTCDGDLPSPVSMSKKRKENSGVACTVTPTKSTRTSLIKGDALTSERRHTRRSSLLAGIDVPPVTTPPPTKRKRERRTTARASSSRLPSPPLPSLPQNADPFSVIPPTVLTKASSSSSPTIPLRTSPRRASTISLPSSFAVHVDAKSTTTSSDEEQGDASPFPSSSTAPPASPSPPSQSIVFSLPVPTTVQELGSSTVLDEVRSSSSAPPPTHVLHASPRRALSAETGEPRASTSSLVMHVDASPVASSGNEQVDAASAVDGEGLGSPVSLASVGALASSSTVASAPSASSSSPSSRTSPRQAPTQPAGLVEPVSLAPLTSEGTLASPPESSTVLANAASSRSSPPPSQPLRTSPPRGFTAGPAMPRPSASFSLHVDTSPVPTLDSQEQDDTWPALPTSTSASTSPPTSPAPIRAPTPLRTKVLVHIPSVVVTPPTPPPLASGAPVDAPIPLSDEPVPRPHNPPPQLKIQIPDSEEQMPMAPDSVVPGIIMPPLPPLPAMSPPPQPMQMNMNVVVNVPPPPPPQVDLNGGVWKTACKTRVWELQRRYSPLTIRDLVAQEADDYFLRFGYPKVWNVSREAEGGDGEEEGEDWSEYESELSSDDEEEWGAKRRDDRDRDVDMDGEEDAEGEIDPDAWHDPSFSVQGETVGVEGGGGMMTAFYVPPSPVYDGGAEEPEEEEVQDVDMDMLPDVQESRQSQQPLSPVQPQSPEWSPSSPSTSPFQRISRQRQYVMYENTLPVPPPRLATIPVHALRHMEIGPRVLVGRGTPVDRARAAQWATGVCRMDEGSRGRTLSRERRGGGAGEDRDRERSGSLTPPPTFEQDPNTWDAFFESLKRGEGEASTSASVSGPAGSGGGSGSGGGMMMDLDVSLGHTMQDSFGGSSINVNLPSALDLAPLSPLGSLSPPLSSSPPPSPSSSQCLTVGSDFLGMGIGMGMGVNMNMNLGMGMMGMGGMMGDPLNGGSGMGGVMSGGGGDLGMGMGMFGMGFGVGMGIGMAVGMGAGAGWLPPVPVGVNGVECPPPQLQGGAGVGVVGVGGEGFEQGTSTLSFALG